MEQVDADMRMVCPLKCPFLQSPGHVIKSSREGRCVLGITTAAILAVNA